MRALQHKERPFGRSEIFKAFSESLEGRYLIFINVLDQKWSDCQDLSMYQSGHLLCNDAVNGEKFRDEYIWRD